jgi:hypothetical protein
MHHLCIALVLHITNIILCYQWLLPPACILPLTQSSPLVVNHHHHLTHLLACHRPPATICQPLWPSNATGHSASSMPLITNHCHCHRPPSNCCHCHYRSSAIATATTTTTSTILSPTATVVGNFWCN